MRVNLLSVALAAGVAACQTTGAGQAVSPGAAEYMARYMAAAGHKAMAGTEHHGGHVYRWSIGKASLQAAADEAMDRCNQDRMLYGQIVSCRLLMLNQTTVRGMSDAEVERVMVRESAAPSPARTDWPHIDEALDKYALLPGVKAMAGAVAADGAYTYSWRSEALTMDSARKGAIANCDAQKQKWGIEAECRIIFEGDQDVRGRDEQAQSTASTQPRAGVASPPAQGLAAGTWGGKIVTGSITTTDPKANQGNITLDLGTVRCHGQWTIKPGASSGLVAAGCGGDLSLTGSYARESAKTYSFDGTDSRGQKVTLKAAF